MIQNFKQLEWHPAHESEGVCAYPNGLEYKYLITNLQNGQVRFAILDSFYEYLPGFPELCPSSEAAKAKANDHYISLLQHFIC